MKQETIQTLCHAWFSWGLVVGGLAGMLWGGCLGWLACQIYRVKPLKEVAAHFAKYSELCSGLNQSKEPK